MWALTVPEVVTKRVRRKPTHIHSHSARAPYPATYLAADSKALSRFIIHTDSIHYLWTCWTVCCVTFWSIPSSSCWYYTLSHNVPFETAQIVSHNQSIKCNRVVNACCCLQVTCSNTWDAWPPVYWKNMSKVNWYIPLLGVRSALGNTPRSSSGWHAGLCVAAAYLPYKGTSRSKLHRNDCTTGCKLC